MGQAPIVLIGASPIFGSDPSDVPSSLALSVTHLQGIYVSKLDPFAQFRRLQPVGRCGYSILIYDLRSPRAKHALRWALDRVSNEKEDDDSKR